MARRGRLRSGGTDSLNKKIGTGKVVNLRSERKRRRREEAEIAAAENRARHGRTKAEKRRDAATDAADQRHLDGHRLERPDPEEG